MPLTDAEVGQIVKSLPNCPTPPPLTELGEAEGASLTTNRLEARGLMEGEMIQMKNRVVVIDDDAEMLSLVQEFVSSQGYEVDSFSRASHALEWLRQKPEEYFAQLSFVITDMRMPELTGIGFIKQFQQVRRDIPIILATAFGSIETAIEAMREGAFDYVTKPFQLKELAVCFSRARDVRNLQAENQTLRAQVQQDWSVAGIIGKSRSMKSLFALLGRVAPTSAHVLITGESGTGKELVARAIHNLSPRKEQRFQAINCSAIPETLLESELFGFSKGAFTGANQSKKGLLADADKGTFFLDEIGDLSLPLQAKLLRFLQDKEIRPVGSNIAEKVDVRIVAATHKDLSQGIVEGWFREDLFYRLNVIPVNLPPLRDRLDDIQILTASFISRIAANHGIPKKRLSPAALKRLMSYSWPGNVRQLENTIERALVLAQGEQIQPEDLLDFEDAPQKDFDVELAFGQLMPLKQLTSLYIDYVLKRTSGKKEEAARILGISRRTLYRRGHDGQGESSSDS